MPERKGNKNSKSAPEPKTFEPEAETWRLPSQDRYNGNIRFNFLPPAVSLLLMTQGSSRKLGAALIVIGAALFFAGARSHPLPSGPYAFAAVIQVTKPDS